VVDAEPPLEGDPRCSQPDQPVRKLAFEQIPANSGSGGRCGETVRLVSQRGGVLSPRYPSLWVLARAICRGEDGAWISGWHKSMARGGARFGVGWPALWRGLIVAVVRLTRGGIALR
jgi:hypothetical protein